MGRIGLEKLVAHLRDVFGYETNQFTFMGDAALVFHNVIKEVEKPILWVSKSIINSIATQRGIPLKEYTDEVYGKAHYVEMSNVLIICPAHMPRYHCCEDIGPFHVETLSTNIMLLLVQNKEHQKGKLKLCFENNGHLLLEAWPSDLESMRIHYDAYPEYYEIIEDDEKPQVVWKTMEGIEIAKDDHIYLEYIGMMYVDPN